MKRKSQTGLPYVRLLEMLWSMIVHVEGCRVRQGLIYTRFSVHTRREVRRWPRMTEGPRKQQGMNETGDRHVFRLVGQNHTTTPYYTPHPESGQACFPESDVAR